MGTYVYPYALYSHWARHRSNVSCYPVLLYHRCRRPIKSLPSSVRCRVFISIIGGFVYSTLVAEFCQLVRQPKLNPAFLASTQRRLHSTADSSLFLSLLLQRRHACFKTSVVCYRCCHCPSLLARRSGLVALSILRDSRRQLVEVEAGLSNVHHDRHSTTLSQPHSRCPRAPRLSRPPGAHTSRLLTTFAAPSPSAAYYATRPRS